MYLFQVSASLMKELNKNLADRVNYHAFKYETVSRYFHGVKSLMEYLKCSIKIFDLNFEECACAPKQIRKIRRKGTHRK